MCFPNLSEGTGIVLAGIFASVIAVFGWMLQSSVAWLVWLYRRKAAEYERLIGLRAEIASSMQFHALFSEPGRINALVSAMEQRAAAGQSIAPYTVVFRENIVFDRIKPDITTLPESVIGAVVDYYLKGGSVDASLSDLRSDAFVALSIERATQVIRSIENVAREAVEAGQRALDSADPRIQRFNRIKVLVAVSALLAAFVCAVFVAQLLPVAASVLKCSGGGNNRVSHWNPSNSQLVAITPDMVASIKNG